MLTIFKSVQFVSRLLSCRVDSFISSFCHADFQNSAFWTKFHSLPGFQRTSLLRNCFTRVSLDSREQTGHGDEPVCWVPHPTRPGGCSYRDAIPEPLRYADGLQPVVRAREQHGLHHVIVPPAVGAAVHPRRGGSCAGWTHCEFETHHFRKRVNERFLWERKMKYMQRCCCVCCSVGVCAEP